MLSWLKKERALRKSERMLKRGQREAALAEIEKAIREIGASVDLIIQKAWLLADNHQFDEALKAADLGLQTAPESGVLHLIRGEVFHARKEHQKALEALLEALRLSGDNLRVEYMLGLTYVALGDEEKAARYFESTVRYDKSFVMSRLLVMAERSLLERRSI